MDQRNFTYLFYGFAAAWGIIAAYLLFLAGRERRIRTQIDNLKRMLEEKK
ncbi:MAG: CcmD family protein [Bryobacterales bacterium]|nr:CcmD family protein [Bryobacterales bacterium]